MKCDICDNDATVFVTQIIGDKTTHVNSCDACAKRPDFSFLPFRLKRETPFKSQLGCTFTLTTFLLGMAVFCYFVAKSPSTGESWVRYVAVAAFGLFGLLLLWSFIRQLAALGVKETIVELSTEPLQPGQTAQICVIQAGPAKLKSLRANLLCFETCQLPVNESRTAQKLLSTENLIDAKHLNVSSGDSWHEIREFSLPADAPLAGTSNGITISWKIEVWGRGYALGSFMHPFAIDVFHGQRLTEQEAQDEETTDENLSD